MRRLLLISYFFPPLAGPGVFRPLRLAKYLPERGWQVSVVTVSDRARLLADPGLEGEVPAGVRVERTPTLEPRGLWIALGRMGLRRLADRLAPFCMLPDEQRGWVPFATRRARAVLRDTRHDVVLSTAGPYSTHLVGSTLRARDDIPWVADFRDEWTTNPYLADRYPTRWHLERNRSMERRTLRDADLVTCVSRPWLDALRSVRPDLPADKFAVMPNGYDSAHFPDAVPPQADRFRIVYTGMFYGHRSPETFFRGLERLLERGTVPVEQLRVVLMGHGGSRWGSDDLARRFPAGTVEVRPQRPYREALAELERAAVLLLVVPRAGGAGNHTGKLFPYLASGRPILALAPEGNVAAELVRESRSGVVAPPDDAAAVAVALERLWDEWRNGTPTAQRRDVVERYEARAQADDWARLLERVAASRDSVSTSSTTRRETTSSA